jgi:hypothetical protein
VPWRVAVSSGTIGGMDDDEDRDEVDQNDPDGAWETCEDITADDPSYW